LASSSFPNEAESPNKKQFVRRSSPPATTQRHPGEQHAGEEEIAPPQGAQLLRRLLHLPRALQGPHRLLTQRLLPADEALRNLLSASRNPILSTSNCIVAELRRLGKSHNDAFRAAKLVATTKWVSFLLAFRLVS
jgi:hypothetical protein